MVGQADNLSGQDNNTIITPHDPFVVMAKPVGPNCNLECSYCYYLETKRHYEAPYQFRMSDAVLETYIRQCIEASPGPTVSFVWHGGEPTLAGLDFYKRALELQKRYLPAKWSCWNNLQTNGTLLNEDWCSFIANEHFDVGISIDGTRWVHDRYRKDLHGKGTYETAVAAVRRLQTYGVQPDLLCTVTSTSAQEPLDIYRALRDLNTGWIQFIPIVRQDSNGQITPDSISSEAYGHFLSVVFDEWIYHDLGKLNVQFFAEMALVWSGGRANPCWMAPICGRVLIVEHDGSVYSCDHFVTPEHRIGNLRTSTLSTLVDSPAQLSFGENKRTGLPGQCRNCRWLAVCNGECPKNRLILADDGSPGLNYLCKGLRFFFTHSERPLKRVIERQKQGIHSKAIMAELRAELVAKWKGVGRNDPCPCGSGLKAKQCCWSQRP
jgi:uncharacterized protein